nr:hypothetical protein [uncultured Draconibacterium sp.]
MPHNDVKCHFRGVFIISAGILIKENVNHPEKYCLTTLNSRRIDGYYSMV